MGASFKNFCFDSGVRMSSTDQDNVTEDDLMVGNKSETDEVRPKSPLKRTAHQTQRGDERGGCSSRITKGIKTPRLREV